HSLMTTRVPVPFRARALSLIGGSHRFGRFAGPFLAAGLLSVTDATTAPVWAFVVCLALAALLVGFAPDPERLLPAQPATGASSAASAVVAAAAPERPGGVLAAIRAGRIPLLRIGGPAAILSGLRSVKDVLLPLWGV